MNVEWIVCERTSRWAPALRVALANHTAPHARQVVLCEVRSLAELGARFQERPNPPAFIEVTSTNLDATLTWLAETTRRSQCCRVVAMLEDGLNLFPIAAALREAGAIDVAESPRRLQKSISVGLLHTLQQRRTVSFQPGSGQSMEEWARSLLPWQVVG